MAPTKVPADIEMAAMRASVAGTIAAIAEALLAERLATIERCARLAEGPVFMRNGAGEVNMRGTEEHHWTVATPTYAHNARGYGRARTDAAAAIRALK